MLTFVSSTPRWLISSFWRFVKVLLQALGSATRATLISLERKRGMWPNLVSILFHSKPFFITCKVYLGPFVKHLKNNTFIFKTKFWVLKKLFFFIKNYFFYYGGQHLGEMLSSTKRKKLCLCINFGCWPWHIEGFNHSILMGIRMMDCSCHDL